MKKICALILIIALTVASVFALSSCSDNSDIPDGMQLVFGGEAEGYYFYAPEEWTVSNTGEIKSAYASRVDSTSVSLAEVYPIANNIGVDAETYFFNLYFNDSLSEFPESMKPTVTLSGEPTVFGKEGATADKAVKYTYNYKYLDNTFGFMQILMKEGDRYFVFTFCALLEVRTDNKTYYDYYLEKLQKVIEEFRFVEITAEKEKTEYAKDADGFLLISEKKLAGFDLYVPESFVPDYSSAIISATHADGSNVTVSEATGTGENPNQYVMRRFKELEGVTGSRISCENAVYDENGEITDLKHETVEFGNATAAYAYEYKFTYNGSAYQVYQVLVIDGFALSYKGYVFTYTAKEANYSLHIDEINAIIQKVKF